MTPAERIEALELALEGVPIDFRLHGDIRWLLRVARAAVAWREAAHAANIRALIAAVDDDA